MRRPINEGFYNDTHKDAIKKLDVNRGEYRTFVPSSGYPSVPDFDKERKFNHGTSIYGNHNKDVKRGLKIAISRLEDIWYNMEKIFWRGNTNDKNDVESIKSFWPKYVREFNTLMKKLKQNGDLKVSDEKRFAYGHVKIDGDFRDWTSWFNNYNPYFGHYVKMAMTKGDSDGGPVWSEVLNWSPDNYEVDTIIGENNSKFVYRVSPIKYKGKLNESKKSLCVTLKSKNRLNRKQLFEKVSSFINKKYGIFVESVEVEASGELEPNFLKAMHHVVEMTIPVEEVYGREILSAESMNDVEIKNLIDGLLSDDISDMLGSSESVSSRLKSKLKEMEEKNAKVYRVYKDGIAIDTFIKKICGIEKDDKLDFYKGSVKETLKAISSISSLKIDVKTIICEKDYCLVLVMDK